MLDTLIGASADSWFRMFAVTDRDHRFEPGLDEQIATAWLGHARVWCRKGLRFVDRPVRHIVVNFREGFDRAEQFGSGQGEIRSAVASSVARNRFIVEWTESLLDGRLHAPTQQSIDAWLQGCIPNVAVLAENAVQVRELKRLSEERHGTEWLRPDGGQTDIFGVVRFGRRLVLQYGELHIERLGDLVARHIDVLIVAGCGPGLPVLTRKFLDQSGSKPLLFVDVRDRKNAPSQLQRWGREREQNYLRSGWLRLGEDG